MKKIPTLFKRDERGRITRDVTPGCEWVLAGEGIPTRKLDGTCCKWEDGKLLKRREIKLQFHKVSDGKGTTLDGREVDVQNPPGIEFAQFPIEFRLVEVDRAAGKAFGWVDVGDGPEDKWHREALENSGGLLNGHTYELCGPKINGNPENYPKHVLLMHGMGFPGTGLPLPPFAPVPNKEFELPTFDSIRAWLEPLDVEGIVWWHMNTGDDRKAKIKKKDFGLPRRPA